MNITVETEINEIELMSYDKLQCSINKLSRR